MRAIVLVTLALAGCGSKSGGGSDLSAPADLSTPPDLSTCTIAASGDLTMSSTCGVFLCHPSANTMEFLDVTGTAGYAHLDVTGAYAVKSYATGDFSNIDVAISDNMNTYAAHTSVAGSSASLTLTTLTEPTGTDPCSGTAHGTIDATLVGWDTTTGMPTGSGAVHATFAF